MALKQEKEEALAAKKEEQINNRKVREKRNWAFKENVNLYGLKRAKYMSNIIRKKLSGLWDWEKYPPKEKPEQDTAVMSGDE